LIGDLPFYVAHDSADVWAHREVFHLARDGTTLASAGVPPDAFSATGQLWGNPLYRWNVLRRGRFGWWVARVRRTLERFDAIRLDHFIGFYRVWRVPAGAETAAVGEWERSPGAELLRRLRAALGGLAFLAEDLGLVTPEVERLRDAFGLPGTRVLQFGFDAASATDPHLPHNFPRHCVVCTGTHDHDTIVGWYRAGRGAHARRRRAAVRHYTGGDGRAPHWDLVRLALMSVGDTVILPVQDLLGLGSQARMNLPGTSTGNWEWRLAPRQPTAAIVARLARLTAMSGRGAPRERRAESAAAVRRRRARRSAR
jgi:4-alpha-glucanotransferase